jgi:hypothetical protein
LLKAIAYQLLRRRSPGEPSVDQQTCWSSWLRTFHPRPDMVLADRPLPSMDIKGWCHLLGECGIAFQLRALAGTLGRTFPANHGVPDPGRGALRVPLLRWLERRGIQPTIVGEFDDSALMSAFGQAGAGVFPVPLTTAQAVMRQHEVIELGRTLEIRERFFAISVERRLSSSGGVAVSEAARRRFSRRTRADAPVAPAGISSSQAPPRPASSPGKLGAAAAQLEHRAVLDLAPARRRRRPSPMNFWSSGSLQRGIRPGFSP